MVSEMGTVVRLSKSLHSNINKNVDFRNISETYEYQISYSHSTFRHTLTLTRTLIKINV